MGTGRATRENLLTVVYGAIDELNELLPTESRLLKRENEQLLSETGKLDSLGYINFVTALEQRIEQEFGVTLSLSEQDPRPDSGNPFRDVSSLIDFLRAVILGKQSA